MTHPKAPRGSRHSVEHVTACTCFNLRKAARAVTQYYDEALADCGLRTTQFTLLAALDQMHTATVSDLARTLVMDRTTLTRNLRPLEQCGWVQSAPGTDRRVRELTLTAAGSQVLQHALPLWKTAQKGIVQRLGRKRWDGLLEHLDYTVQQVGMT